MIAVVIPCYQTRNHILSVLRKIGPEVAFIFVVDDACPQKSGQFVLDALKKEELVDSRIQVLFHDKNQGVGGAVLSGFKAATQAGASILVKIDGDDQMDPSLISDLVTPLEDFEADYVKGNRFYHPSYLKGMPILRILGNAGLSFLTKFTTGFWQIMDPTNGFVAIRAEVLLLLDSQKLNRRYFFETDLLYQLGIAGAVAVDFPMKARYADEKSHLRISRALFQFSGLHMNRIFKRIIYQYFIRDFSMASLELFFGSVLSLFGFIYGSWHYLRGIQSGIPTERGSVAITTICLLLGFQLLLAFFNYDTRTQVGRRPLVQKLRKSLKAVG